MKDKYNPFKMWMPYIMAVVLWLSLNLSLNYYNFYFYTIWQRLLHLPVLSYSPIILTLVIGFLLGWLIQYLYRKYK